jgi:hypothetical protein
MKDKNEMEKKEVEIELGLLISRTLVLEDELNACCKLEN